MALVSAKTGDGLAELASQLSQALRDSQAPAPVAHDDPLHGEVVSEGALSAVGGGRRRRLRGVGAVPRVRPTLESKSEEDDQPIELAIIGRPNVGKSSLVNALLKVIMRPGLCKLIFVIFSSSFLK